MNTNKKLFKTLEKLIRINRFIRLDNKRFLHSILRIPFLDLSAIQKNLEYKANQLSEGLLFSSEYLPSDVRYISEKPTSEIISNSDFSFYRYTKTVPTKTNKKNTFTYAVVSYDNKFIQCVIGTNDGYMNQLMDSEGC